MRFRILIPFLISNMFLTFITSNEGYDEAHIEIESDDEFLVEENKNKEEEWQENDLENDEAELNRYKRNVDGILKSYIDQLRNVNNLENQTEKRNDLIVNFKKDQEIVVSSGTGFAEGNRFKSGDVHIRKGKK